MKPPKVNFSHLLSISDERGTYEHADHAVPRFEHGYCTDDVARVVLVLAREPDLSPELHALATRSLDFLAAAQDSTGKVRNRCDVHGHWSDEASSGDCWGRTLWGTGTMAARSSDLVLASTSRSIFNRAVVARSSWTRAMAFATLGAAEILERYPNDDAALALVGDTAAMLDRRDLNERWPWPENRLTYANAVLPEALLIAGLVLENFRYVETSLRQLRWLIDIETVEGVLNVISVGGTGPYEEWRQFDQQPIEAAALADACWRAWQVTGDVVWRESLDAAIGWFLGDNAMGVAMYDAHTGGGFDGLTSEGVNLNQGAESTLALIATLQHANRLAMVAS